MGHALQLTDKDSVDHWEYLLDSVSTGLLDLRCRTLDCQLAVDGVVTDSSRRRLGLGAVGNPIPCLGVTWKKEGYGYSTP